MGMPRVSYSKNNRRSRRLPVLFRRPADAPRFRRRCSGIRRTSRDGFHLEREIGNVCRKVARRVVKKGAKHKEEITAANIHEFLGVIRFRDSEVHEKSE